jgi:hypothetical protein
LSLHSLNGFFSQKSAPANAALAVITAKLSQSNRFMVILASEACSINVSKARPAGHDQERAASKPPSGPRGQQGATPGTLNWSERMAFSIGLFSSLFR